MILDEIRGILYKDHTLWNDPGVGTQVFLDTKRRGQYIEMKHEVDRLFCELRASVNVMRLNKNLGQLNDLNYEIGATYTEFLKNPSKESFAALKQSLENSKKTLDPKLHIFTSSALFNDTIGQRYIAPE